MYKLHLRIYDLPKSLNVTLRTHYHIKARINRHWDQVMVKETLGKLPPQPLVKAHVHLIRHSNRLLDYDNCVSSFKGIVDSLVDAGVMIDDSYKVTGPWLVEQRYRPKKDGPLLEIIITEVL